MREFSDWTKDPLLSQGGLCSREIDMKVQHTGNVVANVTAITVLLSERNRQSAALIMEVLYYLLLSDYST